MVSGEHYWCGKVIGKKEKCSSLLGSKSAKRALLEYEKCAVRYGKYNTVFPYRTFSKNSVP